MSGEVEGTHDRHPMSDANSEQRNGNPPSAQDLRACGALQELTNRTEKTSKNGLAPRFQQRTKLGPLNGGETPVNP